MKPFLWGAATSAHQVEGYNEKSDWWQWELTGAIEGAVRSGAATDHQNRFIEDLDLAASLGLNTYRFSIEWAKIEPVEGAIDESAIDWYRILIGACEARGLRPMATLHHFTLPKWFADSGGFVEPSSSDKFARFTKLIVNRLGSRIPLWCTLNEPLVYISGAYLGKFMPPALVNPKKAGEALANLLRAHVLAYDLIHEGLEDREGPFRDEPLRVGYAHNMIDLKPERSYHPLEKLIAIKLDRAYNLAWVEACCGKAQRFSIPFLLPRVPQVKEALGRVTTDFIGVNYYTRAYVQWWPRAKDENQMEKLPVGLSFARRKDQASDLGWSVRPRGLGKILRKLKRFDLPILITENGIADREDRMRPQYLVTHLREIARAIADGVKVEGYYHWSLLDNFEWIKGFWPRFGLFSVDYATFQRTETATAALYRRLIADHGSRAPQVDLLEKGLAPMI